MNLNRTGILLKDDLTSMYFDEIRKDKILSHDAFVILYNAYKSGDTKAFDIIVRSYLRFVVSVAKKYQHNQISLNDLISAGNIGLILSLRNYDPSREIKFTVYAKYYIVREINIQIEKFTERDKFDNAETSNKKKSNLFDAENCVNLKLVTTSLNAPMPDGKGNDTSDTYADFLVNNEDSYNTDFKFKFEAMYKAIHMLKPKEKEIIEYRFGINNNKPLTYKEIADIVGVTSECIRLKCDATIKKIKKIINAHETNLCEEL